VTQHVHVIVFLLLLIYDEGTEPRVATLFHGGVGTKCNGLARMTFCIGDMFICCFCFFFIFFIYFYLFIYLFLFLFFFYNNIQSFHIRRKSIVILFISCSFWYDVFIDLLLLLREHIIVSTRC
jgi:hypothetical protein